MAEADDWETLETLLNKATSPANRDDDWEYIMNFCDKVNNELEGALTACRLLGHKIQSPQEREALQALTVCEACVKNCGEPFHRELGKFRFLNEMIKLISPKYLGNKSTEKVKKRTIELMYIWARGLPHEAKVGEAYEMLKKQGLVKEDPTNVDKDALPPIEPAKQRMAEFEDDEKSKMLARLLKSKHPEDLQAANRLIKNMVKEDEKRLEKVSRRTNELESCNNNVKLLNEMLAHYRDGYTSPEEKDLMKELYLTCERMRPSLFRLASDADEKDDCIADILETNDSVVKVMELYRNMFPNEVPTDDAAGAAGAAMSSLSTLDGSKLIDFSGASPTKQQTAPTLPKPPDPNQPELAQDAAQLLDSQLTSLGLSEDQPSNKVVQPTSASDLEKLLGPDPITNPSQLQGATAAAAQAGTQPLPQQTIGASPAMSQPLTQPFSSLTNSQPGPQVSMGMFSTQQQQQQMIIIQQQQHLAQQQQLAQQQHLAQQQQLAQIRGASMGMVGMQAAYPMMQQMPQQRAALMTGVTPVFPSQPTTATSAGTPTSTSSPTSASSTTSAPTISTDAFADLESLGRGFIKPKQKEEAPQVNNTNATASASSSDDQMLFLGASPQIKAPTKTAADPALAMLVPTSATEPTQSAATPPQALAVAATNSASVASPSQTVLSLGDVFVPLETILPGATAPVTAYEKNNVKTVFHFGKDSPRPDILVVVVSTMSTNTSPLKNLTFLAAVPKTMRVKLQPPSATDLPAFNPILPPAAITQVMLLANPNKEKVRLRFKMQYTLGDKPFTEVGEVDKMPLH